MTECPPPRLFSSPPPHSRPRNVPLTSLGFVPAGTTCGQRVEQMLAAQPLVGSFLEPSAGTRR